MSEPTQSERVAQLQRERDQFRAVVADMLEGVVALSGGGDEGGPCFCDALDGAEPLEHTGPCQAMRITRKCAQKLLGDAP